MSARLTVCNMGLHEKYWFPCRPRVATTLGRRARCRGILHRGGCCLPRRRSAQRAPLAGPGLAAYQKKARRRSACLLWMDESGLLMAPLLRRSWALRGQSPEQKQKAGHREKVSVAAALWLPPTRDRLHLAYQTLVNGYFTNVEVAGFADAAVQGLAGPVIMLWDGGTMHKGGPIREVLERSQGRLDIEPM